MPERSKGLPKKLCVDVSPSLCCGLCENILNNPMQSGECGHRFCQECILEEQRKGPTFKCPSCSKEGDETTINLEADGEIFNDRGVLRELSRLKINCIFCGKAMKLKEWQDDHQHRCEERPKPCELGCGEIIHKTDLEKHREVCPERETVCEDCKEVLKLKFLEEHKKTECESLFASCKYCGEKVMKNEMTDHQRHSCAVSWLEECPYGCKDVDDLTKHRESAVSIHVDRLLAESRREKQIEVVKAIDEAAKKVAEMKKENDTVKAKVKAQGEIINKLTKTIQEQDLQMCAMREEIQVLKSSNYDGTLLWRIDNFREKQQSARNGIQPSIFSPPFFTSRSGYQMCARLYLNGDGVGQGTHLSLFFVLMRGPYDPLLKWPFQQKVTFLLKDQKGRADVVDAFRPDPSGESFKRPKTMMNIASGSPRFTPLDDINDTNKGYVVDDVMFLRVIVDCSTLV